jgi:hypothetical protein
MEIMSYLNILLHKGLAKSPGVFLWEKKPSMYLNPERHRGNLCLARREAQAHLRDF